MCEIKYSRCDQDEQRGKQYRIAFLHFAAATPNIGPYMEFPFRGKEETESWFTPQFTIKNGLIGIPTGPGLGVEIDPAYLAKAKKVEMS